MASNSGNDVQNDDNNGTSQSTNEESEHKYKTSVEYFAALENWLQQAYMVQNFFASLPYLMMANQFIPSQIPSSQIGLNNNISFPGQFIFPVPNGSTNTNENLRMRRNAPNAPRTANNAEGIEYKIPPIWKRCVAESLDVVILLFVRLIVTFIAVDFFDIIDLDKYDLDLLNRSVQMDYKTAVEITSEILVLEMAHRFVVCIFEAFWIRRGIGGRIGGATPGKTVMGIRVVHCDRVTTVEGHPDIVLVVPGTDLGLIRAFSRSFIKNLVLAILFPICFVLFFYSHNRTAYDVLCHTIVIEDSPRVRH